MRLFILEFLSITGFFATLIGFIILVYGVTGEPVQF